MHGYDAIESNTEGFPATTGVDAINALVDALRPLDSAKVRVLRTVVHEMRTPLTTVIAFIELLADDFLGPLTDYQLLVLQALARNVQRLTEFVDALEPADPAPDREGTEP